MQNNSFTKRLLYQSEFVVCTVIRSAEGESSFFTASMNSKNNHYMQRFIQSGKYWTTKYNELFFAGSKSRMLPEEISEELLKQLQQDYPITLLPS